MQQTTIQINPVTLANVADGAAEAAFQSALADIAAAFTPPDSGDDIPWQLNGNACKSRVTIEIEFCHDFERGTTDVTVEGKTKLPGRRKVARPVLVRNGAVFCEPSRQLDMIAQAKALRDGGAR